ncbi:DNA ligase-like protein I [Xylogone sp. PMI_703]|nr:DNA ligase-like protein I [Xylogone sp. PMI_703]
MGTPVKRRKLNNNSKTSKVTERSLDYFFAKQRQSEPTETVEKDEQSALDSSELSDEQLARKLQAEWDKEEGERVVSPADTKDLSVTSNSNNTPTAATAEELALDNKGVIEDLSELKAPSPQSQKKPLHTLTLQSAGLAEDTTSVDIPLDTSSLAFEPSEFVPELQKHWSVEGGHASYALLTRCFVLVNGTQSRIRIVDILVNTLRIIIEGDPSSLLPTVWLATNAISPPYISLELGLGGSAISKALKQVCGLDGRALKSIYDKYGDAGDVAAEAKKRQSYTLKKPKPLTIKDVYQSLVKIASTQGTGSGDIKQSIVNRLLQDARGAEESRYIVRTLCQHALMIWGKLRIGAVKTTMLIALSRAFLLSRPPGADFLIRTQTELGAMKKEELSEVWSRAEEILKACYARRPNYNDIVPNLLEIGVCEELLIRCGLSLHIPLRPMLGNITRDLPEMLVKLQNRDFSCEYKYDGQRAQVHCDRNGKVSIFSRHLELMTDKYPDLVALVPRIRGDGVSSFIMEGEVVAVDKSSGDLKTFQVLSNRARRDVAVGSITIDVCLFAFDLMYLNGEPLLDRPFRERRELLRSLFVEVPHRFTWVKSIDATSQDSENILEFFKSATDNKCEGIMVKILDNLQEHSIFPNDNNNANLLVGNASGNKSNKGSKKTAEKEPEKKSRRKALLATYEPDKRLDSWLKVKKDYHSSFDTLDLIPIAAWHGQGRKAKFWSPILLAVRNETTGSLEAVCKCMSGFTDTFYKINKDHYEEGGDNVLSGKPSYVEYEGGYPDVWFEPQEVWEVGFADISLSPTYTAAIGLVSDERGLSLRFPRFLKKREDKGIDEASTSEFLASLWRKQEATASLTKDDENEVEEDNDLV